MTKSKLNMDVIADRILWIRRMTAPLRHLAAFVRNGWPKSSEYAAQASALNSASRRSICSAVWVEKTTTRRTPSIPAPT